MAGLQSVLTLAVVFSLFLTGVAPLSNGLSQGPPTYNCDAVINDGKTQGQRIQSQLTRAPFSHGKQTNSASLYVSLCDQQHCTAIIDLSPYCFGFFLLGISLAIRYNPCMMMPSKA